MSCCCRSKGNNMRYKSTCLIVLLIALQSGLAYGAKKRSYVTAGIGKTYLYVSSHGSNAWGQNEYLSTDFDFVRWLRGSFLFEYHWSEKENDLFHDNSSILGVYSLFKFCPIMIDSLLNPYFKTGVGYIRRSEKLSTWGTIVGFCTDIWCGRRFGLFLETALVVAKFEQYSAAGRSVKAGVFAVL
jgi:hypothetical protein